jgi:hypothetical protein
VLLLKRSALRICLACLLGLGALRAADVEIPFAFLHNQILLHALVNGQGPFDFIVDTGTRESIVDAALARRLGLQLGPLVPVTGAGGGSAEGRRGVCRQVRIGGLAPADLGVAALDLSRVSSTFGRPLHGVLGYGFLSSYIVQIDYFRRVMRFPDSAPPPAGNGASVAFPMRFGPNSVLPVLDEFYVNGVRLPVTLDTGSSLGLVLFPSAITLLNFTELAREGVPMRASGYLGDAQLSKGWVAAAKIKDIGLGAIEAAYVRKGYGDSEDPGQRGGSLGNAVLQDFLVTLDYPRRTVTLERTVE